MKPPARRTERLLALLAADADREWSRRELADALGDDPDRVSATLARLDGEGRVCRSFSRPRRYSAPPTPETTVWDLPQVSVVIHCRAGIWSAELHPAELAAELSAPSLRELNRQIEAHLVALNFPTCLETHV